ncbi:hypothetical protein BO86DRAFT_52649 [Aspergillus japonicus CBS 114.51]|uniref:Uncharacterized protein n=1 Tax=Aspergillus japonicus CBS 114.51 TaxID=1448312 RepID=A0A8T8WJ81_ASPJA|nr:hypothetical protein BO86DRAFT_52649 [Aspergillus japonicus CBS 114.51]RAH75774.1 hypothetical protein BO86DRAFT_52649 [Aspergillus japonicus CBS 114.51]
MAHLDNLMDMGAPVWLAAESSVALFGVVWWWVPFIPVPPVQDENKENASTGAGFQANGEIWRTGP